LTLSPYRTYTEIIKIFARNIKLKVESKSRSLRYGQELHPAQLYWLAGSFIPKFEKLGVFKYSIYKNQIR